MNRMQQRFLGACLALMLSFSVSAFTPFVVKQIEIDGNQRISRETILNYLPITVGEQLTQARSGLILRKLYETHFFDNVALSHTADSLIIKVVERPTIGAITIEGNKLIPSDKLKEALKTMGLVTGEVYNQSIIQAAEVSLKNEYYNLGRYSAKVRFDTKRLDNNRIELTINIAEGKVAQIAEIRLVGNKAYTTKELLKQFKLSTPNWLSWFTSDDQYSKEKLSASLENLRSFYLDRGYIKFRIDASKVAISPDHRSIYITVRLQEGARYTISGINIVGKLLYPKTDLDALMTFKAGDYFSREAVIGSEKALAEYYGERGYAYPLISIKPLIEEEKHTVSLRFDIDPGKRFYVRRISFKGNSKTEDIVLRREMRQFEGAMVSSKNIKESVRRLNLLGYLKDVKPNMTPVAGKNNQVDLQYDVTEQPSAEATFGIAYSTTEGIMLNASLKQNNFMGTGKMLDISFDNSVFSRAYRVAYNNPYCTLSGIQCGYNVFWRRTDPRRVGISSFATNQYGGGVDYSFPMTENSNVGLGLGYRDMQLLEGGSPPSQISDFIAAHARSFKQILVTPSWLYNGLDRAIFPQHGTKQSIDLLFALPANNKAVKYYTAAYNFHYYHPLYEDFILKLRGELAYGAGMLGDSTLPFFSNFYAGGIDSVRGYESYSLGPRDSQDNPIGGNLETVGSLALIFPNPISKDNVRTSLFWDVGNVYQTVGGDGLQSTGFHTANLRHAVGLGVVWRTPLAPLAFSVAKAIKPRRNDHTEVFQFTIAFGV